MLGFAPNERSRERRCISSHEAKVIADSYGFQHRDIDFDSEMAPLLQKLVADIRRDEYEAVDDAASIPLVDMIVLGDVFVGKTSLVNRLMTGEFENKYVSTMPTRPRKVKVVVDDSLAILRLRDTPGTMYTNIVTPEFMNTIHSAIIVYDTTSRPTFETAQQIRRLVLAAKQDRRISVILVGNKNDDQFLCPRQVSFAEGAALARSWKCPFLEISCKTGNVDHVFKEAIREYRLTFNYDIVSSPKLDWSGFVQLNISGAKFQKKWLSVRAGKVSYGTKADSIKSLKQIDMSPDVGVIEGNHDKGSLLILSVIGITPHIQCLLPTHAERAALADALFSELAFLRVMDEILTDVTKLAIQSVYEPPPKDSSLCILAHGRLPSGSTSDATGSAPSSSTTSNTSSATQNHGSNGNGLLPTQPSPYGNLPSTPAMSGSTPFRRIKN
jgi:small GTP-binding protein